MFSFSHPQCLSINDIRKVLVLTSTVMILIAIGSPLIQASQPLAAKETDNPRENTGALYALSLDGASIRKCTLQHTDVSARISGYIARVTLKQQFRNPFKEKIEALYTFPLDANAAVDSMSIQHGTHKITGSIKRREEARLIYDEALAAGKTAALLDQERPNIFTQSIANIEPNGRVDVTISYVTILPFESGKMSFVFPTVVGPRFDPSRPTKAKSIDEARRTMLMHGLSSPAPRAVSNVRSGHDLSLSVTIDAGCSIDQITSKLHSILVAQTNNKSMIKLANLKTIPNRDFVLTWHVSGPKLSSSYLAHRANGDGYVTFMVMPPDKVAPKQIAPRELIFVVDCSGSQAGRPIEKAKETMWYILDRVNPKDTIQIIGFSNESILAFSKPTLATRETVLAAKRFVQNLKAIGGTFMAPAIRTVCSIPTSNHRLRIVSLMTDGYIGNDQEVLGLVKELRGTSRWFSFGTGDNVNRFLIDGIAREGGGEAEYVLLNDASEKTAKSFCEKISSPVLTDVKLSFEGIHVKEVYPSVPSDVWANRPLYFVARYSRAASGSVQLSGFCGGKAYEQTFPVSLPDKQMENAAVKTMWARKKIEHLCSDDYLALDVNPQIAKHKSEITNLGLKYGILTNFTSFVAVDESSKTSPRKSGDVDIPIEQPTGDPHALISTPYGYNDTYVGLHTFWGDDITSQLFANIGQLIGKWLTEFINGWMSDAIQALVGLIKGLGTAEYPTFDGSDKSAGSTVVRGIQEAIRIGTFIVLIVLFVRQKCKAKRNCPIEKDNAILVEPSKEHNKAT